MILTIGIDLDSIKTNQYAKYGSRPSHRRCFLSPAQTVSGIVTQQYHFCFSSFSCFFSFWFCAL